jgi:hypothetical protein
MAQGRVSRDDFLEVMVDLGLTGHTGVRGAIRMTENPCSRV